MSADKPPMRILVLERGVCYLGRVTPSDDALFLTLTDCAVIRVWGTTHGLGQIALHGPTDKTVLDPEPDGTRVGKLKVVRDIACTWEGFATWTPPTT